MGGRGGGSNGTSGKNGSEKKAEKAVGGGADAEAILHYQGEGYVKLNGNLRKDKELTPEQAKAVKGIDKSMKATEEEMTLYRGLGGRHGEAIYNALAGSQITDKAYTSTSKSKKMVDTGDFGGGYKAKITIPKGSKVLDINKTLGKKSIHKHEKEVLLPRNAKFGVAGHDAKTNTVHLIYLGSG